MKILKNGNLTVTKGNCSYCGCEYEYDDTDLHYDYMLTSTGINAYVNCPCCGRKNFVNSRTTIYPGWPYYGYPPITCNDTQTYVTTVNASKGEENV